MKIEVEFRRRPSLSEEIVRFFDDLSSQLAVIEDFWSLERGGDKPLLEGADDIAPTVNLNGFVRPGLSSQLNFAGRFPKHIERDDAIADDALIVRLDTDRVDYAHFCRATFPQLVDILGAYRARVETDRQIALSDFSRARALYEASKPGRDGRNGVIRLWPVCFIDDLLCRRSFGLPAEVVVQQTSEHCERAELRNGGALLIVTTDLLTGAELDVVDAKLKRALAEAA